MLVPEPSSSYILNAQRSFSSDDPQVVISVAIINSFENKIAGSCYFGCVPSEYFKVVVGLLDGWI